jgi:hypothetical protein
MKSVYLRSLLILLAIFIPVSSEKAGYFDWICAKAIEHKKELSFAAATAAIGLTVVGCFYLWNKKKAASEQPTDLNIPGFSITEGSGDSSFVTTTYSATPTAASNSSTDLILSGITSPFSSVTTIITPDTSPYTIVVTTEPEDSNDVGSLHSTQIAENPVTVEVPDSFKMPQKFSLKVSKKDPKKVHFSDKADSEVYSDQDEDYYRYDEILKNFEPLETIINDKLIAPMTQLLTDEQKQSTETLNDSVFGKDVVMIHDFNNIGKKIETIINTIDIPPVITVEDSIVWKRLLRRLYAMRRSLQYLEFELGAISFRICPKEEDFYSKFEDRLTRHLAPFDYLLGNMYDTVEAESKDSHIYIRSTCYDIEQSLLNPSEKQEDLQNTVSKEALEMRLAEVRKVGNFLSTNNGKRLYDAYRNARPNSNYASMNPLKITDTCFSETLDQYTRYVQDTSRQINELCKRIEKALIPWHSLLARIQGMIITSLQQDINSDSVTTEQATKKMDGVLEQLEKSYQHYTTQPSSRNLDIPFETGRCIAGCIRILETSIRQFPDKDMSIQKIYLEKIRTKVRQLRIPKG